MRKNISILVVLMSIAMGLGLSACSDKNPPEPKMSVDSEFSGSFGDCDGVSAATPLG